MVIRIEKLKKTKTIKELKDALVEIFEELDIDIQNIAYDVMTEVRENEKRRR